MSVVSCSEKKEKKTYDFSSTSSKKADTSADDLDSLLNDLSALAEDLEGTASDALKEVDNLLKDTGVDKALDTAKGALDALGSLF